MGYTFIIVITSVLFSVAHIQWTLFPITLSFSWFQLIYAFVLGVAYGLTYVKSESIIYPMIMHGLSNFLTEIDTLRWDYYQYIISHPISRWDFPTAILYGGRDNLQPIKSIRSFAEKFDARLTISEQSEHPFMAAEDKKTVDKWLLENI